MPELTQERTTHTLAPTPRRHPIPPWPGFGRAAVPGTLASENSPPKIWDIQLPLPSLSSPLERSPKLLLSSSGSNVPP